MSSVTNEAAKRRKILPMLKPQTQNNNKLSFSDWVANRDELDQLNARVENISTKLDEVLRRDEDTETDEEFDNVLFVPRSQVEFDAIRSALYEFNKKNHKLGARGKKVATWGEHQEFFTGNTPSTRYRSAAHKKNDPRLGYEFNGVKWTCPATKAKKKKRKRPTQSASA